MQDRDIPLCVDLDGTLLRSDLLFESALSLIRANPLSVIHMAIWLIAGGKANLKRQIAQRTTLDVSVLPYETRVLGWLREENGGRRKILCSASDQTLVDAVARHVGGFDEALGSDGVRNLAGVNKGETLSSLYGEKRFDYAGNAGVDQHVWNRARRAVLVNAPPSLQRHAQTAYEVERVFERESVGPRTWLKALRLHQWLKNLLVFLPLLTAHQLFTPGFAQRAAVAFLSFGLCASATYIINDLLDLDADRRHRTKRARPFASGALQIRDGLMAAPLLLLAAFALAFALSPRFALVLLGYCVLTLAYSLSIKRVAVLDVVALAALYTIRIIAGTVAIGIDASFWLLAFSMFLFLSLAMIKRYTELRGLLADGRSHASGRGYSVEDLPLVQSLGAASGYLSVLVCALYINSTASELLYGRPQVLWLLCPLLLYWISRAWLIAHRGEMHDDPVVFAVTDPVSRIVVAICAVVVLLAI
ncbi:UbiA family prenyltransferase [Dokdonella sp.]|uniref:UbiA family prenyltransferase n=1 Tax=Dokdonella sp. TaxID=2291710 RepID=UPI001B0C6FFA|nr:UbiA family prenyltransferase [Dokdonella sp.]MBO9663794.1 UbiA family prenyltransferase [Dokdonella sp.]